jgi:hypothetical protein
MNNSYSLTLKTRLQIANEYGVHVRTLSRWILKHDLIIPEGLLTPRYQKIIYEKIGYPPYIVAEWYHNY